MTTPLDLPARDATALVTERRAHAAATLAAQGAPDRAQHLWRYTDPERLEPASTLAVGVPTIERISPAALPEGVTVLPLATALERHPDLVARHLGVLAPAELGRPAARNLAEYSAGLFVHVARGVRVVEPLHLVTEIQGDEARFHCLRLVVALERGAELAIVDEQRGGGRGRHLVNVTTELDLAAGAHLAYAQVQGFADRVTLALTERARLAADANLRAITVALGSSTTKADVGAQLAGRGASLEMLGIIFGDSRQHFDHHTLLDHAEPNTTSRLDFRVALSGHAASAYTGVLRIRELAIKSDARQENRNLLLSSGARADAIPELEILTDDVAAAHGVAAGPIDGQQVFYCQTRGLDRRQALEVIVQGFFDPIIARVPGEAVRDRLRAAIEAKLTTVDISALPEARHEPGAPVPTPTSTRSTIGGASVTGIKR